MESLLIALRAAGEPTRLRLLALLDRQELTVSELTRILGQSQPRVSRHLKLLCDARLLDRHQEGSWAFYRLAARGEGARQARAVLDLLDPDTPDLVRDLERLEGVKRARAQAAGRYFAEQARRWDSLRSLYVPEAEVEAAMLAALGGRRVESLLDLGTGTGRVLEVLAGRAASGLGVDQSREMLAVARNNLDREDLRHCRVRQGDLYALDLPAGHADAVVLHHVLHFLADPGAAISEAARVLAPGGLLLVVDFAPHGLEFLRGQHAHRRLGFPAGEVAGWMSAAGLCEPRARNLHRPGSGSRPELTVTVWTAAQRPEAPARHRLAVA